MENLTPSQKPSSLLRLFYLGVAFLAFFFLFLLAYVVFLLFLGNKKPPAGILHLTPLSETRESTAAE